MRGGIVFCWDKTLHLVIIVDEDKKSDYTFCAVALGNMGVGVLEDYFYCSLGCAYNIYTLQVAVFICYISTTHVINGVWFVTYYCTIYYTKTRNNCIFKGCESFSAKFTRLHNDANALCLGGRVVGVGTALELVDLFVDTKFEGGRHQGIIAIAAERNYASIDEILEYASSKGEPPFVVVCDGVEDPHNLGAIIRSAECAGAHGIIIPKRHAVGITPAVYKSSAGAIEHMAISKVTNIATTIEDLKKRGVWVFASEAGGTPYYEADYDCACAIVLGSEGNGVGKLIKEKSIIYNLS